jgi:hypothetical protein
MRDNFSLAAAAAGGFMLSVALAGILRGTPVSNLQTQASFRPLPVTHVAAKSADANEYKTKKS